MPGSVEELTEWCERSRQLLKTTKLTVETGESRALRQHIQKVARMLGLIEKLPQHAQLFKDCKAEFDRLANEMDSLSKQKGSAKDKEKKQAQEQLNQKFTTLEGKLQVAAQAQERTNKARQAYDTRRTEVRKAIDLLRVLPKGSAEGLARTLQEIDAKATSDASEAGFDTASQQLKDLGDKVAQQRKVAEGLRQSELDQWKHKPDAEKKLLDATNRLQRLENMVGIEDTLLTYRGVLGDAKKCAENNDWNGVLRQLKLIEALPDDKKLAKKNTEEEQKLGKVPRHGEALGYLERLAKLLPAEGLAKEEAKFRAASNQLLLAMARGPADTKDFYAAVNALRQRVSEIEQQRNDANTLHQALAGLVGELHGLAPMAERMPLESAYESYASLVKACLWDAALEAGQGLKQRLEGVLPAKREHKQAWLDGKEEMAEHRQTLDKLRGSGCPTVLARVPAVANTSSLREIQRLEQDCDWTQLAANVIKSREEVGELRAMDAGFRRLAKLREQAQKDVMARLEAVSKATQQLQLAVAEAVRKAKVEAFDGAAGFKAETNGVMQTWAQARDRAIVPIALEVARSEALTALDGIVRRIGEQGNPAGLAKILDAEAVARQRPMFEQQWKNFESLVAQLRPLDTTAADTLAGKGRIILGRAAADWRQAALDLAALLGESNNALVTAQKNRDTQRNQIATLAKAALDEINRVKSASGNRRTFAEAFAALVTEHNELVQMGASPNAAAIAEAAEGLRALKVRASRFAPENDPSGAEGPQLASVRDVAMLLEKAEQALKSAKSKLEENVPKQLLTLAGRLPQLKTEVHASDPDVGASRIAAFDRLLEEALSDADKVIEVRAQFTERWKLVVESMKLFRDTGVAPQYAKQLQARVLELRDMKDPNQLFNRLTKLKTLELDIKAALVTPGKALEQEKAILKAAHDEEAQKIEYGRTMKLVEGKYIGEAAAAVKSHDGDSSLLLELERMVAAAKEAAGGKTPDWERALREARLIVTRAQQITVDPYGPAIGSRNNLPKDQEKYREALAEFNKSLRSVRDATLQAVPKVQPEARKRLETAIEALAAKFDSNAFESAIRLLQLKDITAAQRRGHREEALAKVRNMQARLASHPQVQALLSNPAAKSEFSVAYRNLLSKLTLLDANIQRCCR